MNALSVNCVHLSFGGREKKKVLAQMHADKKGYIQIKKTN
jgi:hypothetical protein